MKTKINYLLKELKYILTINFFILISGSISAQERLSLEEAISIGLENNYNIQLSKKELKIAEIDNSIGNAGFLPSLDGDGSYSRSIENTELSFADGTSVSRDNALSTNLNAGLGANWYIFDGTKMFVSKKKFEELEALARLDLELNISNALAEIIGAYHFLIAEKQTLQLYREQLIISQARLELSNTKLQVGASSELENIQAEVDANADQSAVYNQEVRIEQAKARLNRLMGRPVETAFEVNDSIAVNPQLQKDSLQLQLQHNPNLTQARKSVSIAVLEKKETFAERLPKIGLNGRYSYVQATSEAGFLRENNSDGITYGAIVTIPIFNGFEKNRKEQQDKIRIEQRKISYDQELAMIEEEFITNYQEYENNLKLLSFEEKSVALADKNLKFALENYRLGGISSLDLREVQLTTLAARERLIALKYTVKITETELLRLTNQLIETVN